MLIRSFFHLHFIRIFCCLQNDHYCLSMDKYHYTKRYSSSFVHNQNLDISLGLTSIYIKISKKNSFVFIGKISVLKIIRLRLFTLKNFFHFLMGFTTWILSLIPAKALIFILEKTESYLSLDNWHFHDNFYIRQITMR